VPGIDDRLRRDLERLAKGAEATGSLARVARRKRRHRTARRVQTAALAAVVLAATAGGGYALTRAFRQDTEDVASTPAVRNGKIAFVRSQNRHSRGTRHADTFVMDPDGDNLTQLSDDSANEGSLDWSPDGKKLAFVRESSIYVMNADGSGLAALTSNKRGQDDFPEWSPDGARIAFTRSELAYCDGRGCPSPSEKVVPHVHIMNADGTGVQPLSSGRWYEHDPTWSPDGSAIAFVRSEIEIEAIDSPGVELGTDLIYAVAPDGSNLRKLASMERITQGLEWSPDGKRFLFAADAIYTMWPDGTQVEPLAIPGQGPEGLIMSAATWSPDGTKIAFAGSRGANRDIYTVNADGTGLTQLTNTWEEDFHPAWQPVPQGAPTVEPTTPEPTTPPEASPSPTKTPVSIPFGLLEEFEGHFEPLCGSAVIGQFDGKGKRDIAAVAFPLTGETCPEDPGEQSWRLYNSWNDLSYGSWSLPECARTCRAFAAADLDGDGAHELFITSDEGASTRFLRVFGVPLSPIGPIRFGVASPGSNEFPAGEPLVLEYGGSVTHQGFVTCAEGDGEHHVIATVAQLSNDQTEWAVTETIFSFDSSAEAESVVTEDGSNEQHAPAFTIVSSREYTVPYDPEEPLPVPGNACWALD
jgi:Tol biopolymer transport system component